MCKEKKHSLLTQNDFPTQQVHANRKKLRQIENIIFDFIPKMVTLDPSHQTVVEFLLSIRSSLTQKRRVDEIFNFLMVGPPPPIHPLFPIHHPTAMVYTQLPSLVSKQHPTLVHHPPTLVHQICLPITTHPPALVCTHPPHPTPCHLSHGNSLWNSCHPTGGKIFNKISPQQNEMIHHIQNLPGWKC